MWASRSSAWAAIAKTTALAVVVSRTRVTVRLSGLRLARATGPGPSISGHVRSGVRPAVSGPVVKTGEHGVGAVDLVAGGGEIFADWADLEAAGGGVLEEPGGFGLVGVGAGAGVDAQLGFEGVANGAGFDEANQALGEDRGLGPGG
jgi:hypothetical protein